MNIWWLGQLSNDTYMASKMCLTTCWAIRAGPAPSYVLHYCINIVILHNLLLLEVCYDGIEKFNKLDIHDVRHKLIPLCAQYS